MDPKVTSWVMTKCRNNIASFACPLRKCFNSSELRKILRYGQKRTVIEKFIANLTGTWRRFASASPEPLFLGDAPIRLLRSIRISSSSSSSRIGRRNYDVTRGGSRWYAWKAGESVSAADRASEL